MKNREKILKYISDLMDEAEKSAFENELKNNSELKSEYEKIISSLRNFKTEAEVRNDYFNQLEIKVREKVFSKRTTKKKFLLPALASAFALVILFVLFIPKQNSDNTLNTLQLTANDENIVYDYLENNFDELEFTDFSLDNYFTNTAKNLSEDELIDFIDSEFSYLGDEDLIDEFVFTVGNQTDYLNNFENKQL